MLDEKEEREAQRRHAESMRRLQSLRGDVAESLSGIINRYYDRRIDEDGEEGAVKGRLRDELRSVQRRIDETINNL